MSRWMRAAEIKTRAHDGRSAHGLRRTAASDVMDSSGDIRIVQAMLGHVRIESTAFYLRPVPLDKMREAMEGRNYGSPGVPPRAA
jgi:integrase